ncbi:hypothetical protein RJ639_014251, partial [Escallonia herrerae]
TVSGVAPLLATLVESSEMTSIKVLAESLNSNSIPSDYVYSANYHTPIASTQEDGIPVIDYSLLTSGTPDQQSKAIQDLGKACEEWGFFLLVNHGVSETLIDKVFDASSQFFNLTEEEKREFEGKNTFDPITCGTSFRNAGLGKILLWRDYLKVIAHPEFRFPDKPQGFSELSLEYCEKTRKVARELLRGIRKSLGLEESDMDSALNLDSGFQLFDINLYPPCPQPELAIGLPPHTDHGLVTLVLQNGVNGLEVQHNGKWVSVDALPNSFMVNTSDQLEVNYSFFLVVGYDHNSSDGLARVVDGAMMLVVEDMVIFSNGKYKSVKHRAVVNSKITRISLVTPYGPSLDTIVSAASKLVDSETHPPAYIPMMYKEYVVQQQNTQMGAKSCLERVRVQEE